MNLLSVYMNIVEWLDEHMLQCPSKYFLHMDCPGCGLQRGMISLLRGNLQESFRIYPATLPILVMFVYLLLHLLFKFKNAPKNLTILFVICAGIILVHYIYKVINHQLV